MGQELIRQDKIDVDTWEKVIDWIGIDLVIKVMNKDQNGRS